MRAHYGARFGVISLVTVFGLQGVLMWLISLPLQVAQVAPEPGRLTLLDGIGALLWLLGFGFEAVGDWQLVRFKGHPGNRGKVMDRGLWAFTRHPNYFGDAVLWWGLFVIAAATPGGAWTIVSPAVMTFFLMRVSGVPLLERSLLKTRPQYADYARRTSAFFPWPPRRT
jgi:steroid 5-alpha reductase family enzyme